MEKNIQLVSWEQICEPESQGGLNIQNNLLWNEAPVSKHVWNVASKKDNLWVKWVNGVYLKGYDIWNHSPMKDVAWYWRRLNKVKEKIRGYFDNLKNWKLNKKGKFTISSCYKTLQDSSTLCPVAKWIWGPVHILKYSFIPWLAYKDKLLTAKRILDMN